MEKNIILVRGLPGAGKTELAWLFRIGRSSREVAIISADDYMLTDSGEYKFDPTMVKDCHIYCHRDFHAQVKLGTPIIVIHNTFTMDWEMSYYEYTGKQNGYKIRRLIVENTHGGVSVHGVPDEKMKEMQARFQIHLNGPSEC